MPRFVSQCGDFKTERAGVGPVSVTRVTRLSDRQVIYCLTFGYGKIDILASIRPLRLRFT
jgi:hypothetical protein